MRVARQQVRWPSIASQSQWWASLVLPNKKGSNRRPAFRCVDGVSPLIFSPAAPPGMIFFVQCKERQRARDVKCDCIDTRLSLWWACRGVATWRAHHVWSGLLTQGESEMEWQNRAFVGDRETKSIACCLGMVCFLMVKDGACQPQTSGGGNHPATRGGSRTSENRASAIVLDVDQGAGRLAHCSW